MNGEASARKIQGVAKCRAIDPPIAPGAELLLCHGHGRHPVRAVVQRILTHCASCCSPFTLVIFVQAAAKVGRAAMSTLFSTRV